MTAAEEIRAKIDLVELIGQTVPLKQSGQNFKANCPFHNERTPSFYVFPDRQTWHCFGACATGGDAFSFVMRRDAVGFGEALRLLAAKAGVQLETSQTSRAQAGRRSEIHTINRTAAMFFHDTLLTNPEAAVAREHLAHRGVSRETIEDYRLGYSPVIGAGLFRSLTADGHNEEAILASGLFRKRDDGSLYPFFHGRLITPIQDAQGEYAGFGARELDGSKPKYLNSAQTAVFDKSAVLYGLYQGSEAIKKERLAVLVEGYFDVLMAHQYGFKNVVAAMGVALSDRQVTTLRRLANTFVLALDPDAAGDEATLRSLESSWRILDQPARAQNASAFLTGPEAPDLIVKVMDLPRGLDPDEVIRADPADWTTRIKHAAPVVDYVFASLAKRFDLQTPRGKSSLTQRLAPFIFQSPNVYEQNQRIRKLAGLLQEDENVVKAALGAARLSSARIGRPQDRRTDTTPSLAMRGRDALEANCMAILLRYPELASIAASLTDEHFSNGALQEIYRHLAAGSKVEDLRSVLPEELEAEVDALQGFALPPGTYREREHALVEIVQRLEERRLKLKVVALGALVEADPTAPDLGDRAEDLRGRLLRNATKSG